MLRTKMGIELLERHVASVQKLRSALNASKKNEVAAHHRIGDGTMYHEGGLVIEGALVSYGISYYAAGLASAKYVQRILAGTKPKDLPVESVDKIELMINRKLPGKTASRFHKEC